MSRDFQLFVPRKKSMSVERFATDADLKQSVTSWLGTIETGFFYAGIQALVPQLNTKCLCEVVTAWKYDVCHLLPICHAYAYIEVIIMVSGLGSFLLYFLNFLSYARARARTHTHTHTHTHTQEIPEFLTNF